MKRSANGAFESDQAGNQDMNNNGTKRLVTFKPRICENCRKEYIQNSTGGMCCPNCAPFYSSNRSVNNIYEDMDQSEMNEEKSDEENITSIVTIKERNWKTKENAKG